MKSHAASHMEAQEIRIWHIASQQYTVNNTLYRTYQPQQREKRKLRCLNVHF